MAAAFVAYAALVDKAAEQNTKLLISYFGLVCSFAWTLQNRGSKYWQESWESKVGLLEKEMFGTEVFTNKEPRQRKGFWGAWRFSVSRLMIAMSDFTILVWIAVIYFSVPSWKLAWTAPNLMAASAIVSAGVLLIFCRSGR